MLFRGAFFRKRPGKHELGFVNGSRLLDDAVEGRRHPFVDGMAEVFLQVLDRMPRALSIPFEVQILGGGAELHDEISREVLRLSLSAFFAP